MSDAADTVFLFDVDNTLLDNDRIQDDLREELTRAHGERACERYWAIFEELRSALGYADYLGALERLRIELSLTTRRAFSPRSRRSGATGSRPSSRSKATTL